MLWTILQLFLRYYRSIRPLFIVHLSQRAKSHHFFMKLKKQYPFINIPSKNTLNVIQNTFLFTIKPKTQSIHSTVIQLLFIIPPNQQYNHRQLIMATATMKPYIPEQDPTKRKLELCKGFAETGFCPYGQNCFFAHGLDQLHQPTLKTKMCRNFHQFRYCRFGSRCNFVHDPQHASGQKKQLSMLKMMEEYPDFLTELSFRRKFAIFWKEG